MRDTRDLVIASVGAGLAVAVVQGLVGGVAFWLLGLGAPVVWGVVIALCSLIPVGRRGAGVGAGGDRAAPGR
jgi:predicted PurR-regulated permease PerM